MDGKVLSVNISEKTGTIKHPVEKITITESGVMNDAHAGDWHRQVSLLAVESIEKFSRQANRKIHFGEFAENITTQGIELPKCNIFDRFQVGETELELTQIGKECHGTTCAIFKEVGNCVMPKEGIFCRVLKTGTIQPNDEILLVPKVTHVSIVTLSDRASAGVYEDRSGPKIKEMLDAFFSQKKMRYEIETLLIPDNAEALRTHLNERRNGGTDFVFTTGGTGIGERDITVETVSGMLDKEIPGIMELIRVKYGMEKPNALLSRGVAGIMGKTIVYTLPGSVKAVSEYMSEITKTMEHTVFMLHGIDKH
ncbi:MAG: molybdenum cofactor synthesis protein [Deltaproteobacteria bacterium]|nr:MAG: molybdenum cofactor synthesis protein [Deltaproteobacteria bacterium]